MPELHVLAAVLACPGCGTGVEAVWAEPEDGDAGVAPQRQMCGGCGLTWIADWPGYSYRTEAG